MTRPSRPERCIRRIEAALVAVGAPSTMWSGPGCSSPTSARWEQVGRAHGEFFAVIRPVATMVQVAALIEPQLLVEIEADAVVIDQPAVE